MTTNLVNRLLLHPPDTVEVAAPWQPAKKEVAQALILDSVFVEGSPSGKFLILHGTLDGADLSGKVYQLDGTKGKLANPVAQNWTEYLAQELEREEEWLRERESESLFG